MSTNIEKELHKSMKNKELIQLLDLEKSLVFFSTSLKANESTIERIQRGRFIKMYEDDEDLIEDVLIETKQAIEMSNIYSSISNRPRVEKSPGRRYNGSDTKRSALCCFRRWIN